MATVVQSAYATQNEYEQSEDVKKSWMPWYGIYS